MSQLKSVGSENVAMEGERCSAQERDKSKRALRVGGEVQQTMVF